jgi:UDPglucose 6-dehydrogenase
MANERICVVGTGYVGMASAIGFASLGHTVSGYDILPERIEGLQRGVTPYREQGIGEALRAHLDAARVDFHADLERAARGARYIVITVGTPSRPDGSADTSAVDAAIAQVAPLARDAVVVLRSTVPAGTSDRLADEHGLELLYAPEFLREGSAVADFLNPDRIVVGARNPAAAAGYAALLRALDRPLIATTYRNAELIKACSNAFLALKISFANEIANLCDALGADARDVLHGVGHDRRIGHAFLGPGIGFGGPCFEKDVRALDHVAARESTGNELFNATLRVNAAQPRRVVDILEGELGGLAGSRVAVWGLAFKAGTDDVRDSLALRIVDDVRARGGEPVAYDPAISPGQAGMPCAVRGSALEATEGADALLVLTDWAEFGEISPWALAHRLRRRVVVDGRNILDPDAIAAAGLRYRGIGRRAGAAGTFAAAS